MDNKSMFMRVFEENFDVTELDGTIILIPTNETGINIDDGVEKRDVLYIMDNDEGLIFATLCTVKDILSHKNEDIIHILEYSMSTEDAEKKLATMREEGVPELEKIVFYRALVEEGLYQNWHGVCFSMKENPDMFEDMFNSIELINGIPTSALIIDSISNSLEILQNKEGF